MAKVKVSELQGLALDWAVAKCEGLQQGQIAVDGVTHGFYNPSTNWAQGGPIIEREEIDIYCYESPMAGCGWWVAEITGTKAKARGNSPLIAAMRCYVKSKLIGNEIEVPDALLIGANASDS